jgi:DNA-binding NtrC family response regulator
MQAGAWSLVSKPVNIPKLLTLVGEAVKSPLILVVDDDADLCDNLWEIFREKGYRVHLAHDAQEAEKALHARSFQVILVDMKLPGANGSAVFDLIRGANQQAQTLVITGYPNEMESRVREALASGARAVCYKPFDVPALLNTIRGLVEKQSAETR